MKNLKREFEVMREGENERLTICSKHGEPFDRVKKIKFYLYLGWKVYDLNGNPITTAK